MTNTKFRKRALLSSVAMLLIALVAMGSATFAWYQANTSVGTSGKMNLKTTSSSGLLILSDTELEALIDADDSDDIDDITDIDLATNLTNGHDGWSHDAQLGKNSGSSGLQPLALNPANGAFFYAEAPDEETSHAAVGATISNSNVAQRYIEEKVYFMLEDGNTTSGDVMLSHVSFAPVSGYDIAKAARIAIYTSTGAFVCEYAGEERTGVQYFTATGAVVTAAGEGQNTFTKTVATAPGNIAANSQVKVSDVAKTATTSNCAIIRVYLDGGDGNTTTAKSKLYLLQELISSMQVKFELANAA